MRARRSCSILFIGLLLGCALSAQVAPRAVEMPLPAPQPSLSPRPSPSPSPTARPSGTGKSVMFQIALVLADNEPSKEPPQALPKGLQKALADIQDFLPFKSYRLYDSALVRSTGEARAKLKGPDGAEYVAAFSFRGEGNDRSDGGGAHTGYLVDPFSLDKEPTPSEQPLPPGVAPRALESPQVSSFRIRPGETVVVGSSGLAGGKSLIVVLTALP
jgi:hypothetical protein